MPILDTPFIDKWYHKLFKCPTFWKLKRAFTCPVCGAKYRCYWDGHDVDGLGINVCGPCFDKHIEEQMSKERI